MSNDENKKLQTYSFHFQCWNCLKMHEGKVQSEKQELAFQCNEFITWNNEYGSPDLFYLLGKPRVCGRVNHTFGRKVKK